MERRRVGLAVGKRSPFISQCRVHLLRCLPFELALLEIAVLHPPTCAGSKTWPVTVEATLFVVSLQYGSHGKCAVAAMAIDAHNQDVHFVLPLFF